MPPKSLVVTTKYEFLGVILMSILIAEELRTVVDVRFAPVWISSFMRTAIDVGSIAA